MTKPIKLIDFLKKYSDAYIIFVDQRLCETMRKDYNFQHFEPLMLLAKNIIDLTEEIKPEYISLI